MWQINLQNVSWYEVFILCPHNLHIGDCRSPKNNNNNNNHTQVHALNATYKSIKKQQTILKLRTTLQ